MTTIFVVCGKVNDTNLSRYSDYSERTYRRHVEAGLGLEGINQALISQVIADDSTRIAVVDCTVTEKSGRHTYGLDGVYNGNTQRAERGLEGSVVAVVDLGQNTGDALSAQQTEAGLAAPVPATHEETPPPKSCVDFYFGHLAYCTAFFPPGIRYGVADGSYSKLKWVSGVVQLGFHSIGRLRSDANLKFLYEGPQKRWGNRRRYDGKVNLADPSRFTFVETLADGVSLDTAVVWSVSLKRPIRLAYRLKEQDGRQSDGVLFSTDSDLDPLQLYRGYAARFQIEFIFRDARQFTGLADCQARSPQALDSRQCQPLGPDPGQSRATLHSSQSGRTPQVLHGFAQTAGSK